MHVQPRIGDIAGGKDKHYHDPAAGETPDHGPSVGDEASEPEGIAYTGLS